MIQKYSNSRTRTLRSHRALPGSSSRLLLALGGEKTKKRGRDFGLASCSFRFRLDLKKIDNHARPLLSSRRRRVDWPYKENVKGSNHCCHIPDNSLSKCSFFL